MGLSGENQKHACDHIGIIEQRCVRFGVKMSVYEIDPLRDPRWPQLLQSSVAASVFHTRGWLEALQRTYDYEPVAYTTSPPGADLANGWVFCRVRSWLTGNRLVSLPFSDHCDPLVQKLEHYEELSHALQRQCDGQDWKYLEYRPLATGSLDEGFESSQTFCLHKLDLEQDLESLFRNLHKDSTQRKIKRADREGLTCVEGYSELLLSQFYRLLVETRRRHQLPPQPLQWFINLAGSMGSQLKIRVALTKGVPIASILTLSFKRTLVYKYGCANERFFGLGGMQMLFWQAIKDAKEKGMTELDLGRSEVTNQGLIVFKDRLGAARRELQYWRYPSGFRRSSFSFRPTLHKNRLLSCVPARLLSAGGKLLYKHFG